MADGFGCDLGAVQRTATQLASVAQEMRTFGSRGDAFASSLRSDVIQRAIRSFEDDSSRHRDQVVQAVDGLERVLDGLIEGCRTVDVALFDGLAEFHEATSALPQGTADRAGAGQ